MAILKNDDDSARPLSYSASDTIHQCPLWRITRKKIHQYNKLALSDLGIYVIEFLPHMQIHV